MDKKINNYEFGNRLTDLRKAKHKTQNNIRIILATEYDIEISSTCYSDYENGKRFPDILCLDAFSKIYNVSVEYLLYGTKEDINTSIKKIVKICSSKDAKTISNLLSSLATAFEEISA